VAWEMPRGFSTAILDDHHAEPFGPDVRIDGYVHRAH